MQTLGPGTRLDFRNDRRRPVELVLQTDHGSRIRMIVPIGCEVEFSVGNERATVYVLEPDAQGPTLRSVGGE
ncbi:hypothetical protein [Aquisalimonas sp.]|uniref:hypothetical protein n=1 Tax=Aquisalimonas sp. TaxID=1872621 RepID=UPI0025B9A7F7|nr:hypothetical protein [Aquisalimonas sp.]